MIEAFGAVAIANSIAYISELLDPISMVLGLTRRTLMKQSLEYLLFGEGETGLLVYSILVRYWEAIKRSQWAAVNSAGERIGLSRSTMRL